jgi:hypothetical protein
VAKTTRDPFFDARSKKVLKAPLPVPPTPVETLVVCPPERS